MKAKIFYDLWEMECCGTPFKIGEGVNWLVRNIDGIKDTIEVDNLDYIYDRTGVRRMHACIRLEQAKERKVFLDRPIRAFRNGWTRLGAFGAGPFVRGY